MTLLKAIVVPGVDVLPLLLQDLPEIPPEPPSIRSLEDRRVQEYAVQAWRSVCALSVIINTWILLVSKAREIEQRRFSASQTEAGNSNCDGFHVLIASWYLNRAYDIELRILRGLQVSSLLAARFDDILHSFPEVFPADPRDHPSRLEERQQKWMQWAHQYSPLLVDELTGLKDVLETAPYSLFIQITPPVLTTVQHDVPDTSNWPTISDAAILLAKSVSQVSRDAANNKLRAVGKGKAKRIDPMSLVSFLQKQLTKEERTETDAEVAAKLRNTKHDQQN